MKLYTENINNYFETLRYKCFCLDLDAQRITKKSLTKLIETFQELAMKLEMDFPFDDKYFICPLHRMWLAIFHLEQTSS